MIILVIILDLFITAFSYLLVPVIFIIRGKKMARKQLWKISIINGCCVCFAFIILRAILEVKHSSWAVALYTPIGHWIMSKYLLLPDNGDTSEAKLGVRESNLTNTKENSKANGVVAKTHIANLEPQQMKSISFCRKCGNKLIPNSAFCNKCGFKIDNF